MFTAISLLCIVGCTAHRKQIRTVVLLGKHHELRSLEESIPVDLSHAALHECSAQEARAIALCLGQVVDVQIEVQSVEVAWLGEPLAARVRARVAGFWRCDFYLRKETNGDWSIVKAHPVIVN
jgi:hypothetical protein